MVSTKTQMGLMAVALCYADMAIPGANKQAMILAAEGERDDLRQILEMLDSTLERMKKDQN